MQITVTSTTDTPEAVTAAQGGKVEPKVEASAAAVEPAAETIEASETPIEQETKPDAEAEKIEKKADGEDGEKKKKKGGFKKRIDRLNTKLTDAEQRAQYWQNEAQKKAPIAEKPASQVVAKADGKPIAANFESHEEYVEALTDWKVENKLSQRDQKSKELAAKSDYDKAVDTYKVRVKTFMEKHPDFDEVVDSVNDVKPSITVQHLLLESEMGPELTYELAKNPAELERISSLPAIAAAREMGKLEAKLAKASVSVEEKETKTTKAPAPIKPVGTKAAAGSTKSPDEMDYREFKKWRESQLAKG